MDFRQYDNATGRFNCIDLLAETSMEMTPYHFGRCNPNYWADPSGLYADDPRYLFDGLGRSKFDEFGMYIPPIDRGAARPEILTFLIENFGAGNESPTFNGNILDLGGLGFIRRVFIGNADIAPIPDFDGSFQTLSQVVIKPMYGYEFVGDNGFPNFATALGFGLNFGELVRQGNVYSQFGTSAQNLENLLANKKYLHRGQVYWRGNYKGVTQSMKNSLNNAKFVKGFGNAMTGIAIGASLYEFGSSNQSGADYAKLTGSIIITATAAIPIVGPFISVGLGIADGLGAFDGIYNSFD
jgi:hypothetical protein